MQSGKVNMLLDAQWGSSGKGKFAAFLADEFSIEMASSSNGPNAGHTVDRYSVRTVFKCLPAACASPNVKQVFITGAAVFNLAQLQKECEGTQAEIFVHERATELTSEHSARERNDAGLRGLASTLQGTGAAMCDKLMRRPVTVGPSSGVSNDVFRSQITWGLLSGKALLHEVSQGFALSIDHGSHYPHCTSRNCTVAKGLDDLGLPVHALGDVYINVRPYPIRVGDLDGNSSGGVYPDCQETSWSAIGMQSGMPNAAIDMLYQNEKTTVTKRLRRVFTFSEYGFAQACQVNAPTGIIANFVQYLDWTMAGRSGMIARHHLPVRVASFVEMLEEIAGVPVLYLGTGPAHEDVLRLV